MDNKTEQSIIPPTSEIPTLSFYFKKFRVRTWCFKNLSREIVLGRPLLCNKLFILNQVLILFFYAMKRKPIYLGK